MRKSVFFLIALVLIVPVAYGVSEIPDPAKVSKLNVRIVQSGQIDGTYDAIEWLRLNLTATQQTPFQRAATQQTLVSTPYGDKVIQYYAEKPSLPFSYHALTLATIQATHTYELPDTYSIPEDALPFLEPTEGIQSDDPRIKKIAESVTKDAIINFEKVALLAIWVNEYMTYDVDSIGNENKDALWALENKAGVCAEYTALYIALARSIGIPTRYVSAWAYGANGWESHAYAESYIGGWVPVDALWLQAGNLDATHIKFSVSKDNKAANDVAVYGKNVRNLKFLMDNTDIKILNFEETKTSDEYDLLTSAFELGPDQQGVVILKFKGKEYQLLELSLEPCVGDIDNDGQRDTIVGVKNKKQVLILEPGKDTFAYWQFMTAGNLASNAIYTCPLALNSRLLKTRTIDIRVNTADLEQDEVTVAASLAGKVVNAGNQQTVFIKATRASRGKEKATVGALGGGKEQTFTLEAHEDEKTFAFSFPVNHPGKAEAVVYSSTGELLALPYEVSDEGDIIIEQSAFPSHLAVNTPYNASIKIRNRKSAAQQILLDVIIDGKKSSTQIRLDTVKVVSIPLLFTTEGEHKVSLALTGKDVENEQTYTVSVFQLPELMIEKALFDKKKGKAQVTVSALGSGVKGLSLDIEKKRYLIGAVDGTVIIDLDLPLGAYVGKATYRDLADKEYTVPFDLFIKEQGFLERVLAFFRELVRSMA